MRRHLGACSHAFAVAASAAVPSSCLSLRSETRCFTRCSGFRLCMSTALRCVRRSGNVDFGGPSRSSECCGFLLEQLAALGGPHLVCGVCSFSSVASASAGFAPLWRRRCFGGVHARCLVSAGSRRLVTWRFGACSRLELHPVGRFLVCGASASRRRLRRLVSASAGASGLRTSAGERHAVSGYAFGCDSSATSVAPATMVPGIRFRLVSCRDALRRLRSCRVSYTARAGWSPRWPVCTSVHVHSALRCAGDSTNRGSRRRCSHRRRAFRSLGTGTRLLALRSA